MRVTVGQLEVSADHAVNRRAVRSAHAAASSAGSDLLVLPEYASGYAPARLSDQAEALDGPFVRLLRELSADGPAILAGLVLAAERDGDADDGPGHPVGADGATPGGPVDPAAGATRDASDGLAGATRGDHPLPGNAVLLVQDGAVVGIYRKVHLFDAFGTRESEKIAAGDPGAAPLVVPIAGTPVGVLTCYDLRFPESARRLVDVGARLLVVPAAWVSGPGKVEQWRVLARARAIENVSAVLAVGQAGPGVSGHSLLVGPDGTVVVEFDDTPCVRTVDVDVAAITTERSRNPSLENRRFDVVPRG